MNYNKILQHILDKENNQKKWDQCHFRKIKLINNRAVGTVGEKFVRKILENLNLNFNIPTQQTSWDIEITKSRIEIKTATEDTHGKFQFNHIRHHRSYDAVICIGIAPNNIYFNIYSKADIATEKVGKLVSMEKGANASFKLTKCISELQPINKFEVVLKEFLSERMDPLNIKT